MREKIIIQMHYHTICMLKKGIFCICIEYDIPRIITLRHQAKGESMKFHENRAQKSFSQSPVWLMLILPYRRWKAWQLRNQTRKILRNMSNDRLEDIGLTRKDIDRL
ncbi:DUF1127 domain-containing protein [Brenneria roseae]|uniref:DUF1127 domain-containing protein n=1 Tax=Brenneria roseae TaxID=1509241 RepID=UPI003CD0D5ED